MAAPGAMTTPAAGGSSKRISKAYARIESLRDVVERLAGERKAPKKKRVAEIQREAARAGRAAGLPVENILAAKNFGDVIDEVRSLDKAIKKERRRFEQGQDDDDAMSLILLVI